MAMPRLPFLVAHVSTTPDGVISSGVMAFASFQEATTYRNGLVYTSDTVSVRMSLTLDDWSARDVRNGQ